MLKWKNIDSTSTQESNPKNSYLQLKKTVTASLPTPSSANEGGIVYDDTLNILKYSDGSSWSAIGIAGSGTLDQGYDSGGVGAGRVITADGGAVEIDVTAAQGALVLQSQAAGTTALVINRTAANTWVTGIDISSGGITTALSIGANAIAGTNFSVTGAGAVTCTDINSSGTAALTTITCATLTITGAGLDSTAFSSPVFRSAAGGNVNITYDAAGSGTLGIATVSTGAVTIGQSTTLSSGAGLTLTNGNVTLSAGTLIVTAGVGDGDCIAATPLTSQAVLSSTLPAAYNYATGAINVSAGTGSGPIFSIVFTSTHTGAAYKADMTNAVGARAIDLVGAGVRTANLINIVDTQDTAALTLNVSTTPSGNAGTALFATAGTGSGSVFKFTFGGAYTGKALDVDMTNAVAAKALNVTGAGARTAALLSVTDTPGNGGISLDFATTASNAAARVIRIVESGTSTNNTVDLSYAGAYAGKSVHISSTNVAATAQMLVIDGSQAASVAMVSLSSSGIFTNAGSVCTITTSTQPGAANSGMGLRVLDTGAAQATSYAVKIDSTNNEALNVSTGKAHFAEAATFLGSNAVAITPNFVQAGGAANAITVAAIADDTGTTIPLADGLMLLVDLNTRTLQAGANTLNYAAGGAVAITKSSDPTANIGTAYAANGFVRLCYNSTAAAWVDMAQ